PIVREPSSGASFRLVFSEVRSIGSAIVVIDPAEVYQLNIGQFADYIAMVSFVEVNQDADLRANSTILNLFAPSDAAAPEGANRFRIVEFALKSASWLTSTKLTMAM